MKFYEVDKDHTSNLDGTVTYAMTLAEAHTEAKTINDPTFRPNVRITEVEVVTDKEAINTLLNVAYGTMDKYENPLTVTRGRVWGLTPRGGLRPMDEDKGNG